jgi:CTP synthase (UTP-ammonia lyase)
MKEATMRIGIVGDFNPRNPTHLATNDALGHLPLAFDWVPTEAIEDEAGPRLAAYAGLWIAPASPYRHMAGALAAIRHARERGVPLVGT